MADKGLSEQQCVGEEAVCKLQTCSVDKYIFNTQHSNTTLTYSENVLTSKPYLGISINGMSRTQVGEGCTQGVLLLTFIPSAVKVLNCTKRLHTHCCTCGAFSLADSEWDCPMWPSTWLHSEAESKVVVMCRQVASNLW